MHNKYNFNLLAENIKSWGKELGFTCIGITNYLKAKEFMPNTKSIISCAINYLPKATATTFISRYALGRDYHKVIRKRLKQLAQKISENIDGFNYRCFVDSTPFLEKPVAVKAGLGWQGKNSLILNRNYGSWLFLGEILTNLPLPIDKPQKSYCGKCTSCINKCPTKAIIAPYKIDISRCISYLTIEHHGSIPINLRPLLGQHIYGCDECQLTCPWNRFCQFTNEADFFPRHNLDTLSLIKLFTWDEQEFLSKTEGSAIRRIGYERWLRNIAVALGNSPKNPSIITALKSHQDHPSEIVQEHIDWAIKQHKLLAHVK